MYRGKRERKVTHVSKKAALLVLSMVLILSVSVSGTLAYLIRSTDPVENSFVPGRVETEIIEEFNQTTKEHVKVKNNGNVDAYIRAKVVFSWVSDTDAGAVVYGSAPVEDDCSITYGSGWTEKNECWYYKKLLEAGETTSDLIVSCSLKNGVTPPLGAHLQVTVLAQAVQKEAHVNAGNKWPDADTLPGTSKTN